MPYEIDITPVGPNEYPLIRVLRGTIFEPFSVEDRPIIEPALREEGIQLLAHLEGNPLGFLVAGRGDRTIQIVGCAVMKAYRRQGIGARMLEWIEAEADARALRVTADVQPIYQEMCKLLCRRGFGQSGDEFARAPSQSKT